MSDAAKAATAASPAPIAPPTTSVEAQGHATSTSSAPPRPRLMTFFDGQNLFGCAKALYGYTEANYDPQLLSEFVAKKLGFDLVGVRFYTGVHDQGERPKLFAFWRAKLNRMVNRGIVTTQRPLAYTRETLTNPDGTTRVISTGREKGIDLRLGLDMVRLAREQAYDASEPSRVFRRLGSLGPQATACMAQGVSVS